MSCTWYGHDMVAEVPVATGNFCAPLCKCKLPFNFSLPMCNQLDNQPNNFLKNSTQIIFNPCGSTLFRAEKLSGKTRVHEILKERRRRERERKHAWIIHVSKVPSTAKNADSRIYYVLIASWTDNVGIIFVYSFSLCFIVQSLVEHAPISLSLFICNKFGAPSPWPHTRVPEKSQEKFQKVLKYNKKKWIVK